MTRRTGLAHTAALTLAAALAATPGAAGAQQDTLPLDSLVVTASPTPRAAGDVARCVTVLKGAALRSEGLTLLADALRAVSGFTVVRGGSWGAVTSVFLRGGESDHVLVLVDGVQVNQPGGSFDFSALTLENVERIEILRGPASSLYGSDAMAGVVHVITRTGRGAPRLEAVLRGGGFGFREASLQTEGGGGSVGWSVSVARSRADGVLPRNNEFRNTVLSANVRLAPDAWTRASVAVRLGDRRYHFPTDGGGAVVDDNAFTFGDETSVSVMGSRMWSSRLEVRTAVGLVRDGGGTDDQADAPEDTLGYFGFASLDQTERATGDVRATLRTDAVTYTVGAELEHERQRSFSESLSQWGPSVTRSTHSRANRAGYAHVTGSRGAVSFGAGARLEDNERFGRFVSWNAEAVWRPAASTRVRASAGRGVKEPTFFENFAEGWVRGNPALAPERTRSVDAGVDQTLADGRVTLSLSGFAQRFEDLIEYTAVPASPRDPNYRNVAEASARGLELAARARMGLLAAGVDWTWLETRAVRSGDEAGDAGDFVEGSRLLRRPAHSLGVHASVGTARGSLSADLLVVGERDDRDFTTWPARRVTLPSYARAGVAAEVPVRGLRLMLRADNLLDARYEEVRGFAAPGRTASAGVRFTFGGP